MGEPRRRTSGPASGFDDDITTYPDFIRVSFLDIPDLEEDCACLEDPPTDFSSWMHRSQPGCRDLSTVADVGPADMDVNPASAESGLAQRGLGGQRNLVPRHLGIPTVTVPMGIMADIAMPVGLTFAGRHGDTLIAVLRGGLRATGFPPRPPPAPHPMIAL